MAEIGAALGWVDPPPPAELPAARVVLPWWARLLVWLLEPPPVQSIQRENMRGDPPPEHEPPRTLGPGV